MSSLFGLTVPNGNGNVKSCSNDWAFPQRTTGQTRNPSASPLGCWLASQAARSSCFHNYSSVISLAGKERTSGVPGLAHTHGRKENATGTIAFWDLQSPGARKGPGTCSQVQCMLGFVVLTVFNVDRRDFSKEFPASPTALPD